MTGSDGYSWLQPQHRRTALALVDHYFRGDVVAATELVTALEDDDLRRVLLALVHISGSTIAAGDLQARILGLAALEDDDT